MPKFEVNLVIEAVDADTAEKLLNAVDGVVSSETSVYEIAEDEVIEDDDED